MKRIVNLRTFFFTALCAVAAVFIGYFVEDFPIPTIIALGIGLSFFIVLAVVYRREPTKLLSFILCAAALATVFVASFVVKTSRADEIGKERTIISGRVCSVGDDGEAQNVIIEQVSSDGKSVRGKIKIKIPAEVSDLRQKVDVGDRLEGYFSVRFAKLSFDGYGGYAFRRGIVYYATVDFDDLSISDGPKTWREAMLDSLRTTYERNMGEYGDLAFAMVTGDKNFLSSEIRGDYSKSGVAHILAVSGLHVGFLSAFVFFLLGLFKARKPTKALVTAVVLLMYNFLLGYSPSIVRATVMSCVLLFAPVPGRRNDTLNNLGLAVTLILIFSPYSLLDVGFQLSVCSVLGIAFFYAPFKKFLGFMPDKISSSIAVSASAVIGIFPVTVVTFNAFHTYSVVVNLIEIPVLTVAYVYLLIGGIISALLPFTGFLLVPAKWLFFLLGALNGFVASLPGSEIVVYGTSAVYFMLAAYFAASRFVMLPKKFIVTIASVILSAALIVVENIPFTAFDSTMFYAYSESDVTTLVSDNGVTYAIGDFVDASAFSLLLKSTRTRKIDYIYTFGLNDGNVETIASYATEYGVKRVFSAFDDSSAAAVARLNNAGISIYDVAESDIRIEKNGDELLGYGFRGKNASVLFVPASVSLSSLKATQLFDYSVIRSLYAYKAGKTLFACSIAETEDGEALDEGVAASYGFTALNFVSKVSKTF